MPKKYTKPIYQGPAELEVENVECIRGFRQLFSNISFKAEPSSIIQVTGSNGSGKTSLLKIVAGLSHPDHGKTLWNGIDARETHWEYAEMLFFLGHKISLDGELSPLENLGFLGDLRRNRPALSLQDSLSYMGVAELAEVPCSLLSAGQRQRVALAGMLRSPARLWLLDEPAAALDQDGIDLLEDAISDHSRAGGITVFTSHQALVSQHQQFHQFNLEQPDRSS